MKTVEQLEAEKAAKTAEIKLAKAAAAFVAKKQAGKATAKDKADLHALRRDFRENHRKTRGPTANPEPIGAKTKGLET